MIYGSAGFLEIVAYKDTAEKILEIKVGQKVYVKK
jgi:S-adenosylmethionine hydrolase